MQLQSESQRELFHARVKRMLAARNLKKEESDSPVKMELTACRLRDKANAVEPEPGTPPRYQSC